MYMFSRRISIIVICIVVHSTVRAQIFAPEHGSLFHEIFTLTQERTGENPLLQNGIFYEYPYMGAKGHPFLNDNQFHNGSIIYRDQLYEGIGMKYDIFNQQIVMNQHNGSEMVQSIPAREFISEFRIHGMLFKSMTFDNKNQSFYQVISEGEKLSCYYFWNKSRNESHENGAYKIYVFADAKPARYLLTGEKISRFRNNRSFVRLFPDGVKKQVREFLRSNKIKVDRTDDVAMKEVIHFCRTIIENQNEQN